jgi:hypothetical protein
MEAIFSMVIPPKPYVSKAGEKKVFYQVELKRPGLGTAKLRVPEHVYNVVSDAAIPEYAPVFVEFDVDIFRDSMVPVVSAIRPVKS